MSVETASQAPFEVDAYRYAEARLIAEELDLAEPVAIALVRRGHRTVEQATAFLAADERHSPDEFAGIEEAVELLATAVSTGTRITVHGDYDVDGICSTAIVVSALRAAGAECDWLIPDRLADGYGLGPATVAELQRRGTGLLVTADCGIASAGEVESATAAGIDVIVTDHHQPGAALPNCPIVHPMVSGYPFEGLCGAAVAHKLVEAFEDHLTGITAAGRLQDLDLVALATIADMVPLTGENRTLARLGIAELRRARRPGLRALMAAADVEPEFVDEGDIAFRLAPRLNAAGRMYRADAGVELMLTDDEGRATAIARELDAANHERRETEREVRWAAEEALRALPDELREAPAIVVAGAGWHPGVVGIVASRVVERHGRPAIVLSIDETGRARGSGRSVPGFDLLAALDACGSHLTKYGGHRAAAGLELPAEAVEAFHRAFVAHAGEVIPEDAVRAPVRIDAVVGADGLDLRTAEQFGRLAPFGQGNPAVKLLVPSARVADVRPMGEEGRHARFSLLAGGQSAPGVAFNANGELEAATRAPRDLTVRLEVNHWNGGVEPRAVLAGSADVPGQEPGVAACSCGEPAPLAEPHWWEGFETELAREPGTLAVPAAVGDARREMELGRRSTLATIAELTSTGERVLVVSSDAARRAELAAVAGPERFGRTRAVVCRRCPPGALAAAAGSAAALVLTDWDALAMEPAASCGFRHLVAVDPPPLLSLADSLLRFGGPGYAHLAWARRGDTLAESCWGAEWDLRGPLAEIYRALAAAPGRPDAALLGSGRYSRSPESAARCVRVLVELGLAEAELEGRARRVGIVSSERTALERSGAWSAYRTRLEEGQSFLETQRAER